MSGTPTLTAIGAVTVSATDADINAIFKSAAASIATIPAADKFTYNGNTLPQGDGQSVLFIPASVIGNVTIPAGYGYVVVGQGSQVNLFTADDPQYHHATIVGDGFNFQGRASVVANGAGVSNIVATNDFTSNGGPGSDAIHSAGTGTLVGGSGSSFVVDAGAHVTVQATYTTHSANAVTVMGGATANVTLTLGSLQILSGATTQVTLGELGSDIINIGFNPGVAPTVPGSVPTIPGSSGAPHLAAAAPVFTNVISAIGGSGLPNYKEQANHFTINDASSVNLIALGLLDRVDAFAGTSTIFGRAANTINVGAASVFFVGGNDTVATTSDIIPPSDASTIHGGTGNTTVYATAGDRFDLGASQANLFVGGAKGASTVNALSGGGLFFGGTHGDDYNSGTSASQIFVGLGGADTISSAAGTLAPILYALNGERMSITGAAATTVVAFTQGGSVDASHTTGNNDIFAGYGDSGNETLVGSLASTDSSGAAIHDTFVVGVNSNATAATITVDNWHGGDVFFLTGYNAADIATMDNAIGSHLGSNGLTFTLSDKTTISFVGNHPTNFSGAAAF